MRLFRLIAAAAILFVARPLVAQDWIEYVDRAERFQINFPGQPTVTDIKYKSEMGAVLPARVYTAKAGPATYTLTVVNYKGAGEDGGGGPGGDWRGSTAWAAWQFRKRGGEVTYDAHAVTDFIAGHQLQITNKDGSRSYIGIHPHMRRLYIMEATAPAGYPPPSDFPQTLSVLDEQGRRIRYRLDDEGNRIGTNEDARRLYESIP